MRGGVADLSVGRLQSVWAELRLRNVCWGDWAAPTLVFITPFINFLGFNGYDLLAPESLLVAGALTAVGLLISGLITLRPRLLRPLLLAAVLVMFVDIQPELTVAMTDLVRRHWMEGLGYSQGHAVIVVVSFLPFFACLDLLKTHAGTVLTTIFAVMLAATVWMPGGDKWQQRLDIESTVSTSAPGNSDRTLPPVLHIVLDEQIGIEGLPDEVPGAAELRAELTDFYVDNGFRLYGRAFSHYLNTYNSLANLMNGERRDRDMSFLARSERRYVITENDWFDGLAAQGYEISVYQSHYLDVCAGQRIARCTTGSTSMIRALSNSDVGVMNKAIFMFRSFTAYSVSAYLWTGILREVLGRPESGSGGEGVGDGHETEVAALRTRPPALAPLLALPLMDRLIDDLRSAEPGRAYFAHLLLPHRGFLLDESCRPKPDMDSWYDHTHLGIEAGQRLSEASRSARYTEYFKQVRCTHRMLGEALEALSEAGVMDDAIIFVHGDHGSRISSLPISDETVSRLTDADLIDGFSTLYAVRCPDLEPGYDGRIRSIQALFAEHALDRPIDNEEPIIYLKQPGRPSDARMLEHPMPAFRRSGPESVAVHGACR